MRSLDFSRNALTSCVAAAMLAGCGGSQPPIGAPGATPQSRAVHMGTRRDLLYVSSDLATNVYTYPHGKLVSALGGSTGVICSNAAGDVFLSQVNVDVIDEFKHGRSAPIAQLSEPFSSPQSCSADRISGKLAVVSSAGEGVAIFRPAKWHHWRLPRLYPLPEYLFSCGYDARGDLFIDGRTQNNQIVLAEMAKGTSKFENITLDYNLTTAGTVQWDGQYLAVGDEGNTLIRRFSIQGFKGTQVGSLTLSGPSSLAQFWIEGSIVIGADWSNSQVDFWKYPDGGSEMKDLNMREPLGATVSRPN
ncbi:MAG: hypothetical protein WBX26_06150 [Candidatus Cybelea sp.]